jgi:rhamnosyl/mannosyltransferase
MRVLTMVKSFYPLIGGLETTVYEITSGLSKDYDITLLTVSEDRKFRDENYHRFRVIKTPLLIKTLSTPLSVSYPNWLKKLTQKTELIHLHSPHPLGEFSLRLFPPRARLVVTYHFDIVRQKNWKWLYDPLLKKIFKRADAIVVSNPNLLSSSEIIKLFSEKCVVIPYGIQIDEYRLNPEELKQASNLKTKYPKPLILFVGRLVYYKGLEYLIRAMQKVNAQLVIIGEGPLRKYLEALTQKLNLSARVEFVNHLSKKELRLYYHICDIFVLPSVARTEAFGMVLLEAMIYGKPLVTTELGTGTSYVNLHEKTGYVVPPANPEALAWAINKLISNQELRHAMGNYAYLRVKNEFNIERCLERYRELYKKVLRTC